MSFKTKEENLLSTRTESENLKQSSAPKKIS